MFLVGFTSEKQLEYEVRVLFKDFKEEFDPDALSNPPGPADTDLFIQEAEWMQEVKDWPAPKIEANKNPKFE